MYRRASGATLALVLVLSFRPAIAAELAPLTDCQRALHGLNRLGFGPQPGDLERVLEVGVTRWIEQQLYPERISDPIVDAKLAAFPTVAMNDAELYGGFEKASRDARRLAESETPMVDGSEAARQAINRRVRELVTPAREPQRILDELTGARILRAAYSERQLNEVLVDFWMNHFNVFGGKDLDRIYLTSFERDVVRPHIWGCFRDLLLATARSPAMLVYLDNAQSVAEPDHRPGYVPQVIPPQPGSAPPAGLNENYAREILELHTLGVDGGYTQSDVTELARVLTGWSVASPEEGGGFLFKARLHDICAKTVLGQPVPAGGGLSEGEELIGLLARHPSTARHIAYRLCQRLVADEPPADLVARVAKRFLATDGDLRETVRAILEAPEFFDPRFYRAKIKSPFEYVVSAVRAVGGATDGGAIARFIADSGEPLYLCPPPTGYADAAPALVSSGSFLARLNFAVALAANRIPGTVVDVERVLPSEAKSDRQQTFAELARIVLGGDVTPATARHIRECLLEPDTLPPALGADPRVVALIAALLGSPEFQHR
jgi:uncharacterized protein (DUF1800 family)